MAIEAETCSAGINVLMKRVSTVILSYIFVYQLYVFPIIIFFLVEAHFYKLLGNTNSKNCYYRIYTYISLDMSVHVAMRLH